MTTSWADPPLPFPDASNLQRSVDADGWPMWRDIGTQDLVLGLANSGRVVYLPSSMREEVQAWEAEADAARVEWGLDLPPSLVLDPPPPIDGVQEEEARP